MLFGELELGGRLYLVPVDQIEHGSGRNCKECEHLPRRLAEKLAVTGADGVAHVVDVELEAPLEALGVLHVKLTAIRHTLRVVPVLLPHAEG